MKALRWMLLSWLVMTSAARADAVPDAATCYQRSREHGFAQRFELALAWIDRGLEQAPADADLAIWRIRLLGWSGRSGEARRSLATLVERVPEVMDDRENIQLAHDLRRWEDGDQQRAARLRLGVTPSFVASQRGDEAATRVWALARVWQRLRLGLAGELRIRERASDSMLMGLMSWDSPGWSLEAAAGGALGGAFLPELSASLEPSLRLSGPLWAHLRYWRVDFGEPGAHVVAPGLTLTLGALELDLRWWLGFHDGGRVTNAGLLRARWQAAPAWTFELGGGGGDASDHLDPRPEQADGHWLLLGGVRWSPSWRHRVFLSYALRQETVGLESLRRHEVSLGYAVEL